MRPRKVVKLIKSSFLFCLYHTLMRDPHVLRTIQKLKTLYSNTTIPYS